nr:hypothetical protein [Nanoarchaeum sp.]
MEEQKLKTKILVDTNYATSSRYSDINIYRIDTARMATIWRAVDLSEYVRIAENEIDLTDKPLVKERLETFKKTVLDRKVAAECGYYLVE